MMCGVRGREDGVCGRRWVEREGRGGDRAEVREHRVAFRERDFFL